MRFLKKLFISVLILLTLCLYLPHTTFAQQTHYYAKADITEHAPKSRTTPEKDVPKIKVKKTSGWTWLILLTLAGGAAAAASSAGGEESSSGGGGGGETGCVTGTW